MRIDENNIYDQMWKAIEQHDEIKIRELAIQGMELFLNDKISKDDLDNLGSVYLTVPLHEPEIKDGEFKDRKLRYVLEELAAIEMVEDGRAKEVVKRFILFLEGKDYEETDYFEQKRENPPKEPERNSKLKQFYEDKR